MYLFSRLFIILQLMTHSSLKVEIFYIVSHVCIFKTACLIIGVVGSRRQDIVPQCKTGNNMNTTLH